MTTLADRRPAMPTDDLAGRVALVTGSSRGIGAAIATSLAGAGARLVIHSAGSPQDGAALAASLPHAVYHRADVADADAARGLVAAAQAAWGRLDLVVNCAGGTASVPFADLDGVDDDLWRRNFAVHVLGPWAIAIAAAPALRRSPDGCIVNITSVAGSTTTGNSIPYATSKAAADHLTRLLARTLAPAVRVNAIAPGFVRTALTAAMPADYIATYERGIPLRRGGIPDDIADTCLSIARSRSMTGTVVAIDGGVRVK
jgi:ketoreductase RED2